MELSSSNRNWIVVFICCFLIIVFDGMDLQLLAVNLPALMKEFHLSKPEAGMIGTWSLIGLGTGGVFGGWFSDRLGRVRIAVWMLILFAIGTALLAFTHTYQQFLWVRTISAFGIGAEYAVVNSLMAEYVPTEKRTTVLGTLQAGMSVGYIFATVSTGVILPNYGWRAVFLVGVLPIFLAFFMKYKVSEPAGWTRRAQKVKTIKNNEWALIFSDSKIRAIFLVWLVGQLFLQFGFYGVNTWLPTYLVSEVHFDYTKMTGYLVGTYGAAIIGKVIAGRLADRYGRRALFLFGGVATAISLPVIYFFETPSNITTLLILLGFLYCVPFAVNATYMNESFPTRIRGTGVGGSYNVGRAGAALAPVTIGIIAQSQSIGFGLATLGITYALGVIIPFLFIREKMYDPYENEANVLREEQSSTSVNHSAYSS